MRHVLALLLVLSSMGVGAPATAQSLADIARQEEARRKTVTVPGKIYTNSDLKPDVPAPAAPARVTNRTTVDSTAAQGETKVKDEAYWRALIMTARAALERSRVLADAVQSRLNALATDIVNRDDPVQRAQLVDQRQRATAELDRLKLEIATQTKAIADIEEDARRAGVPPGWLR